MNFNNLGFEPEVMEALDTMGFETPPPFNSKQYLKYLTIEI